MTNIWAYKDADRVEITTVDGVKYQGSYPDIEDEEDSGYGEACISITTEEGRVDFPKSEIAAIVVLEREEMDTDSCAAGMRAYGCSEDLIAETLAVYRDAVRRGVVRPKA